MWQIQTKMRRMIQMDKVNLVVKEEEQGQRIDSFISEGCGLSRNMAQSMIEGGHVLLNGKKPAKSTKLSEGDTLSVHVPQPQETAINAEDIPISIVYEDEYLLVVNKPKGMVVHPAAGNPCGTLVNALKYHCGDNLSAAGGETRPGIVHRIDKDTSGLLVVAKTDAAHEGLAQQFAAHSIEREYQAVVYGHMPQRQGRVDMPIGRSPKDRKKMAVTEKNAKTAVTYYEVISEYTGFTHLKLNLETGRTHQIRVHMSALAHPLAGDAVYGPKKVIKKLNGQCLHAGILGFIHPASGQKMHFESPLPRYFTDFLEELSNKTKGGG